MHRTRMVMMALLVGAGALVPGGAAMAQDGRVVVFRDGGFAGPAMTFTRANPDLSRAVTVRSVRVETGAWELCERTRHRSPCVTLTQSAPILGRPEGWRGSMLSIRPVAMPEPEPSDERRRPPSPPGRSAAEPPEAVQPDAEKKPE